MSCCWHGDILNRQCENEQLRGRINPAPSSSCYYHLLFAAHIGKLCHLFSATVARQLSTRDLCEEFCLLQISTLAREWGVSVSEDEKVLGLPYLAFPPRVKRKFLHYGEAGISRPREEKGEGRLGLSCLFGQRGVRRDTNFAGSSVRSSSGEASPPPAGDAKAATGGSASAPAAGANAPQDERAEAIPSPAHQQEGKAPADEGTVSDVTLTAPHFVPADFVTRPEITPFVDGVCQVLAPSEGLGLFAEMNEFGESYAAVESLSPY
uniref:Uncharacterized protein n=1 Tax=Oryza meridionalis TaxID=40149 RepID=A0A0E0DAY3_9ORYZ